ncbi:peptide-methionine (S)-S-oxide reductase MsrA [Priestia megaterium]|nr:peptide-methionine (S)-S-oxide reductase MsrA [Priestia megaterium]
MNALATFAGGCFWCMISPFEQMKGILAIQSGYTGGDTNNPTYEQVKNMKTDHMEAVQISYDPSILSYETLLQLFWQQIDPTDDEGQFSDRGSAYRAAIFYHTNEQKELAVKSKQKLASSGKFLQPIVTPILPATMFYPAEEYHQNYHFKNPFHYKLYREGSGRESFLKKHWPADRSHLKNKLTPLEYFVTQEQGTEPAYKNEYWNNTEEGIYVDTVSGEPLFKSQDQLASKDGWPSFNKPILSGNIIEAKKRNDKIQISSRTSGNHLGYLISEHGVTWYRINSTSLRFIPKTKLSIEGYSDFLILFR